MVSPSVEHPVLVQRELALYGSWYEFFPRSEGARYDPATDTWTSATLRTAAERLDAIAAMGFDVAYLTPVHPIGTSNRKGRNNTLDPRPGDPGSPYAIGSPDGGHDAIEPTLGTFEDFDAFVARARELGLEVALDLALQCSPDHPWVATHPEWFTTRADGSIAYAENPPKKYQDIYPVNFNNDPDGIYAEVLRVVLLWVEHGVTLFRVDNPHTKPVQFWEWLIAEVNRDHPEVLFLAEAFTRPAMMHTLAKVGFHQSYTYFAWRNTKAELTEYLTELSGTAADYMRPSFWPTTHDILTPYMQYGGRPAFRLRAVLAATLVPTYGIYTGYELVENVARPGVEEQIDNEKYEFKPRDWAAAEASGTSLAPLLTRLNQVRRQHPSLQRLRNITFHPTDDDAVICYSKRLTAAQSPTGREDTVIVIVNLDPHGTRETTVHLDMPALGLDWPDGFVAHDLLSGQTWHWGEHVYVRLDPHDEPAHVIHVRGV
jgi:starch synthase (maltosyl-transferring)